MFLWSLVRQSGNMRHVVSPIKKKAFPYLYVLQEDEKWVPYMLFGQQHNTSNDVSLFS